LSSNWVVWRAYGLVLALLVFFCEVAQQARLLVVVSFVFFWSVCLSVSMRSSSTLLFELGLGFLLV